VNTENQVITREVIEKLMSQALAPKEIRANGKLAIWERACIFDSYIVAVDPAFGTDPSAIQVIDKHSGVQMAEYLDSNSFKEKPIEWAIKDTADMALFLARGYCGAVLVVEHNSHMAEHMVRYIEDKYRYQNIYRSPYSNRPWTTTSITRPRAIRALQEVVSVQPECIRSSRLIMEWANVFNAAERGHDDLTMAMAIAQAVRFGVDC
jgi:hypothetical protein